jgi:hypothetical protein
MEAITHDLPCLKVDQLEAITHDLPCLKVDQMEAITHDLPHSKLYHGVLSTFVILVNTIHYDIRIIEFRVTSLR